MTKKQLVEALAQYDNDTEVVAEQIDEDGITSRWFDVNSTWVHDADQDIAEKVAIQISTRPMLTFEDGEPTYCGHPDDCDCEFCGGSSRKVTKTKIMKNSDTGEYIVRAYHNDERMPGADCFESSREDAEVTAKAMVS